MGQFSWLDCITGEQILDNVPRKSYVLVPQEFGGGHIEEECYEGYGEFGGHDVYDLVADWNRDYLTQVFGQRESWICDYLTRHEDDYGRFERGEELQCEKRTLGIGLACYDEDNVRLRYPIKITHDPDAVYERCAPSKSDPNQGWEYEDDWDDDEDWQAERRVRRVLHGGALWNHNVRRRDGLRSVRAILARSDGVRCRGQAGARGGREWKRIATASVSAAVTWRSDASAMTCRGSSWTSTALASSLN